MAHPLLLYYVKKAEEMELGISLTLYVKGLIVEGITFSRSKYYEEIQPILTGGTPATMIQMQISWRRFIHLYGILYMRRLKKKRRSSQSQNIFT